MNYDESPIISFPQQNEYTIEKIASYLNTTDLKQLRLVDKLWSLGSTVALRARVCAPFFLKLAGKRTDQLQTFKDDTKNLQPLNFIKIKFWDYHDDTIRADHEALNDIISYLSPNLEILEFALNSSKLEFNLRTSIFFPLLVKISINNWDLYGERASQFYLNLYKMTPNLEDLGVVMLQSTESILNPLLIEENGDKIRNWELLPKFCSFRLIHSGSIEGFSLLAKFPQAFTTLDLSLRWYELCSKLKASLEQMFEVSKNTLKSLSLRKYSGAGFQMEPLELKFPNFPKLINLDLEFVISRFKISFGGEGKKLNYSKTFPVLKRLAIAFHFEHGEGLKNVWETFFPKQDQNKVCKSLELLELDFETLFLYYLEGEGIDRFRYRELFPNLKL